MSKKKKMPWGTIAATVGVIVFVIVFEVALNKSISEAPRHALEISGIVLENNESADGSCIELTIDHFQTVRLSDKKSVNTWDDNNIVLSIDCTQNQNMCEKAKGYQQFDNIILTCKAVGITHEIENETCIIN